MPYIQLRGQFINFSKEGEGRKQRLTATFTDGERLCQVTWFAKIQTIAAMYRPGVEYVLFGKPAYKYNAWQFVHPEVETFDPARPRKACAASTGSPRRSASVASRRASSSRLSATCWQASRRGLSPSRSRPKF